MKLADTHCDIDAKAIAGAFGARCAAVRGSASANVFETLSTTSSCTCARQDSAQLWGLIQAVDKDVKRSTKADMVRLRIGCRHPALIRIIVARRT
jgi:hypothetical protein